MSKINLKELMKEGEILAEYGGTWNYFSKYYCITTPESPSVRAALENTLKRLLNAGAKASDISELMGACRCPAKELEMDGGMPIGKEFGLPGLMLSFVKLPETAKTPGALSKRCNFSKQELNERSI